MRHDIYCYEVLSFFFVVMSGALINTSYVIIFAYRARRCNKHAKVYKYYSARTIVGVSKRFAGTCHLPASFVVLRLGE